MEENDIKTVGKILSLGKSTRLRGNRVEGAEMSFFFLLSFLSRNITGKNRG